MTTNSNAGSSPVDRKVMPHTPGPWVVVAGDNYRIESEAIPDEYPHLFPGDDLGRMVAMVGNRQPDFGAADAALIAAAPDLLDAAERALSYLLKGTAGWGVAKDILNAAIHKARGHEA